MQPTVIASSLLLSLASVGCEQPHQPATIINAYEHRQAKPDKAPAGHPPKAGVNARYEWVLRNCWSRPESQSPEDIAAWRTHTASCRADEMRAAWNYMLARTTRFTAEERDCLSYGGQLRHTIDGREFCVENLDLY